VNDRKQHFGDWISAVTSAYAPRLIVQHETETVFYGFFVGNDTLAIRYDAFGIKDKDRRLKEASLEISSDEGIGGGGDITYRYSFVRKQFVGFGNTVLDFPSPNKSLWPVISEEQILIPFKGIPFQCFEVQLDLIGGHRSSVRVRITLNQNETAVKAEIRPCLFDEAAHSRRVSTAAKVLEMERYLKMVYEAQDLLLVLGITSPDGVLDAYAYWEDGELSASLSVEMGSDREAALLDFLKLHGLPVPADSDVSGIWFPNLPVYRSYEIPSVPPDPSRLATLLTECLRQVYGLQENSDLNLCYPESG
jgi:hypothetical protein